MRPSRICSSALSDVLLVQLYTQRTCSVLAVHDYTLQLDDDVCARDTAIAERFSTLDLARASAGRRRARARARDLEEEHPPQLDGERLRVFVEHLGGGIDTHV